MDLQNREIFEKEGEYSLTKLPLAKEYHTDGYYVYKYRLDKKQHKINESGKTNSNERLYSKIKR